MIGGFYSGFVPMLFKQIPYTMAKFAVQGKAAESICNSMSKSPSCPSRPTVHSRNSLNKTLSSHPRSDLDPEKLSGMGTMGVALSSGVIAGVAAAIISHPADSLLSKVLTEVFVEPEN